MAVTMPIITLSGAFYRPYTPVGFQEMVERYPDMVSHLVPAAVQARAIRDRPWPTFAYIHAPVLALDKGNNSGAETPRFVPVLRGVDWLRPADPLRAPKGYTVIFRKLGFEQGRPTIVDVAVADASSLKDKANPAKVTLTSQGESRVKGEWHKLGFTNPGRISPDDARVLSALKFPEARAHKTAPYIDIKKAWLGHKKEWTVLKEALRQAVEMARKGDVVACNQALSTAAETAKALTGLDLRSSLVWEIKSEAQSRDTEIKAAYKEESLRTAALLDGVLKSGAFIKKPWGQKPGSGTMPVADRYIGHAKYPPYTAGIDSRWPDTLSLHHRFSSPPPTIPQERAPFPSLSGKVFAPKVQFEFDEGTPPPSAAEVALLRGLASRIGGEGFANVTAGLDPHSLSAAYDRAFWSSGLPPVKNPKVEAVGFSSSMHGEQRRNSDGTVVVTDPDEGVTVAVATSTRESTVTTGFTDASRFTNRGGVTTVVASNRVRVTRTLVTKLVSFIILNRPTAKDPNDPTANQPLSNLRADQITWSQLFAMLVLLVTLAGEKAWEFLSRPEFEEPSLRM